MLFINAKSNGVIFFSRSRLAISVIEDAPSNGKIPVQS